MAGVDWQQVAVGCCGVFWGAQQLSGADRALPEGLGCGLQQQSAASSTGAHSISRQRASRRRQRVWGAENMAVCAVKWIRARRGPGAVDLGVESISRLTVFGQRELLRCRDEFGEPPGWLMAAVSPNPPAFFLAGHDTGAFCRISRYI